MELKLTGLTKRYGTKTAVDNMNLTLTGGVYGLLGANGAGKSTLMRLLCTLQTPDAGRILLDGKNIAGMGERYRGLLGYLPQNFGYYPDFTAFRFLMYIAAVKGLKEKQAKQRAEELLKEVGLSGERNHRIGTFSGGMRQRLGIAQAMLNDPHILILDEPTTGLDPKERIRFRNLISAFAMDRIVILSTHIVSDVEVMAEEILLMKAGRIILTGKPDEISSRINGLVWECSVPAKRAEEYIAHMGRTGEPGNGKTDRKNEITDREERNIISMRNGDNGNTVLRILSERIPMADAVRVRPNLEDLYLFYSRGQ